MTVIYTPRTTLFERALLRTAASIDRFVDARLERRGAPAYRRAVQTQLNVAAVRREAQARGAIGLLPR